MSILRIDVQLNKRAFIILCVPYFAFLTWYIVFSKFISRFIVSSVQGTFSTYNMVFNFVVVLTLVLSIFFVKKVNSFYAIYAWSILASTGTFFIYLSPSETWRLAFYYLLGGSFGIAQLAFFTLFYSLTLVEERGRISGLIGLITLPLFALSVAFVTSLHFAETMALCISLNLGTLPIGLLKPKKIMASTPRNQRKYYIGKKVVFLYLVPWIVFSVINATLAENVSYRLLRDVSPSNLILLFFLQAIGACFGAAIGGVIADFFGRRVPLVLGLTLYGLSAALSGLSETYEVSFLLCTTNGLSWGILTMLYLLVIWGDMSTKESCANRYSLGLATFYLSMGIGQALTPQIFQIPLNVASLLSCILIFLSNIPLILAPELLPLDVREKILFRLYLSLVKKIARSRVDIMDQSGEC